MPGWSWLTGLLGSSGTGAGSETARGAAPSQAQWQDLASALGVGMDYAHQQAEQTAQSQGIPLAQAVKQLTAQQGRTPSQAGLREAAQNFYGYSSSEWAGLSPEDKAKTIQSYIRDPNSPSYSPGTFTRTREQVASAKNQPTAGGESAQQKAQQAEITEIANSPWTKMANALLGQYQAAASNVQPLISGAATAPAQAQATSGALGLLGLSGQSPGAAWLNQGAAAANAATQPVANAMAQQGAQYAAEQGPISQAIAAYGQANALQDITAPQSPWLTALGSHITSNLSYYGEIPTADIPTLEESPALVQALQASGGYSATGAGGGGLTSLSSLKGATGQPTATPAGTVSPGVIPGTSAAP